MSKQNNFIKYLLDSKSIILEETNCFLCSSSLKNSLFKIGPFSLVKCQNCGLIFTNPRITTNNNTLYDIEYWHSKSAKDFGYSDYLADRELYLKTFKKRAKLINAFKSKGKMLDVGCAAGYFMLVMQQVGWETFGVDLSAYATNYAREELHLKNVFTGLLEEMPLKKNYFDLITFWDVIEHLSDPLHELKIAHTLLKNNGLLIIETQNVNSILARIMGKKWHHYKMLEHLYHFSLKTLRILLLKAGFDIQKITHNCAGKYVSINFIIERCERYSKTLHKLLKNLNFLKRSNLYINSFDEMIIMAKKQKN